MAGIDLVESVGINKLMYFAEALKFDIKLRRKTTPSGQETGSTVAAGGIDTDEHKVEVEITANTWDEWDDYVPFPGHDLPALEPELDFEWGVHKEAQFDKRESLLTTDALGKVVIGSVLSNDKVTREPLPLQPDKRVKVTYPFGATGRDPSARTNQVWDGTWDYEENFVLDDATPSTAVLPIKFSPKVEALIKEHVIEFKVVRVKVLVWFEGDLVFKTINFKDQPTVVNSLACFVGTPTLEGPGGVYKSDLKINWDPKRIVDTVEIEAVDETVWKAQ